MNKHFSRSRFLKFIGYFVIFLCIMLALFFGEHSSEYWLSKKVMDDLAGIGNEFCGQLLDNRSCKNIRLVGKNRWVLSISIDPERSPGISEVEGIFQKKGWVKAVNSSFGGDIFCRPPYSAEYDIQNGKIKSVTFTVGKKQCIQKDK